MYRVQLIVTSRLNQKQLDSPPTSGVKSDSFTAIGVAGGLWGQETQGVIFNAIGNVTYPLGGGVDYAASGGTEMKATLGSLVDAYDLFSNYR